MGIWFDYHNVTRKEDGLDCPRDNVELIGRWKNIDRCDLSELQEIFLKIIKYNGWDSGDHVVAVGDGWLRISFKNGQVIPEHYSAEDD